MRKLCHFLVKMVDKVEVGKIEHYFDKIGVAVIQVTGNIKVKKVLKCDQLQKRNSNPF